MTATKGFLFKSCPMCGHRWDHRGALLADPAVEMKGYMANFDHLEMGFFLFNHRVCGTTLSLRASLFTDLYEGPVYAQRRTGTEACPGFCLQSDELSPCPARCECAYVREVVAICHRWEKTAIGGQNGSERQW
jgi:hypothetical protein